MLLSFITSCEPVIYNFTLITRNIMQLFYSLFYCTVLIFLELAIFPHKKTHTKSSENIKKRYDILNHLLWSLVTIWLGIANYYSLTFKTAISLVFMTQFIEPVLSQLKVICYFPFWPFRASKLDWLLLLGASRFCLPLTVWFVCFVHLGNTEQTNCTIWMSLNRFLLFSSNKTRGGRPRW